MASPEDDAKKLEAVSKAAEDAQKAAEKAATAAEKANERADKAEERAAAAEAEAAQLREQFATATAAKPEALPEEDVRKRREEATKRRMAEIDDDSSLDEDDKKILKLHEQGVQQFAIAKKVFKFVTNETVGRVVAVIRKAYAPDAAEIEAVEKTKGYKG